MLRMRNKYCSNCLATQRFLDLGTHLLCERCSKRLDAAPRCAEHGAESPAGRLIAWAEAAEDARRAG